MTVLNNVETYTRGQILLNETDDYNLMLLRSFYTFDASHATVDDLTTYESVASGYARSGTFQLTATYDDAHQYVYLDADDQTFGTLAADDDDPAFIVMFLDTGSDATSVPIFCQPVDSFIAANWPDIRVSSRGVARVKPSP